MISFVIYVRILISIKRKISNFSRRPKIKVITLALAKGGVGKSSISLSLAAELAKKHKTVLIDGDVQGNSSSTLVSETKFELADILNGKCYVEDAVIRTEIPNLFVIPTVATENNLRIYKAQKASDEPEVFMDITDELAKLGFEYVIIDTSPAFDAFEGNIFLATDEVIPVMLLDPYSFDGLTMFKKNLEEFRAKHKRQLSDSKAVIKRIVLNNYDSRLALSRNILEVMQKQSEYKTYLIPTEQNFKRSVNQKTPVQYLSGTKAQVLKGLEELAGDVE